MGLELKPKFAVKALWRTKKSRIFVFGMKPRVPTDGAVIPKLRYFLNNIMPSSSKFTHLFASVRFINSNHVAEVGFILK